MSAIKFEDVKKDIETNGWTLITDKYKNLNSGLVVLCPNQHEINITYGEWRKETIHECPICAKTPIKKINEKSTRKKGYRILALDQSTHVNGWAVYENTSLINYGIWNAAGKDTCQRISSTKAWVNYMYEKFSIDKIILEDIQLQKKDEGEEKGVENVLTYKILAQLQGVLENFCFESGISYKVVPPATWRAASQIKGKSRIEKKKNAQIKVKNFYDVSVSQDEADAILIGKWAVAQHQTNDLIEF